MRTTLLRPGNLNDRLNATKRIPHFPARVLSGFASTLDTEGMAMSGRIDSYMRGYEATRQSGEPILKLGVTVFRYRKDSNRAP
jgi:hypothetical protein